VINEAAVRHSLPYVFGGALAADGQVMVILPGETPCLECLFGDRATTENQPNCVVAGILGPTVGVIASLQAMEAVKILSGNIDAVSRHLTVVSLWENRIRRLDVAHLRSVDCPVCGAR